MAKHSNNLSAAAAVDELFGVFDQFVELLLQGLRFDEIVHLKTI